MKHKSRFYRDYSHTGNTFFNVKIDTSDLFIRSDKNLYDVAFGVLKDTRRELEEYINEHDEFLHSLNPVIHHGGEDKITAVMCMAGASAGVGPMAAVAGAIAEKVGRELLNHTCEVVVENGGDIWMKLIKPAIIGLYVNNIYFKNSIGIKINPEETPCSVCTSTSRLGHSLSFGKADSVTVIGDSGAVADAAATAVCNMVQNETDIETALEFAISITGVRGCVIVFRDKIALQGEIILAPIE